MKWFKVLSAIFLVCLTTDAAPLSDPQQFVNVFRTSTGSLGPLTQVRVIPVDARHLSHLTHNVRAHPTHNIQTLRTVPTHSIQEVRSFPAAHTVQQLRTISAPHTVQAIRTVPTHSVQAVRTVPTQTVVHAEHVPVRTAVVAQPAEAVGVAQYSFGYSIADTETGDAKSRQETRNGDVTTGSYSVADPDGRIRTVTYTVDAIHGFQAHVTYDGEEGPPAIAINAPKAAEIVSSSTPSVISVARDAAVVRNIEPVAVPQRTSLFDNALAVGSPVTNIQAVRTVPTVLRSNAAHVVHTAPFAHTQALRTVPTVVRSDAAHVVHTAPAQTVHAVPQTLRAVTSPTSSHLVHHSDHSTPTATVFRSVSPNVLHFQTAAGLRSVPVVGLGSNQFGLGSNQFLRAVNTVPVSAHHVIHA